MDDEAAEATAELGASVSVEMIRAVEAELKPTVGRDTVAAAAVLMLNVAASVVL